MGDLAWLSQEAHKIHDLFQAVFYVLVTVFLLLGVVTEYFKLPLGGVPSFGPLVGRVLIAAILLHTYAEIANTINDLAGALSNQLGDLTAFKLALTKMGEKLHQLTWSWTSVRQGLIVILSYLCFFLLYFSVHVAQALYLYTSTLLFIFSPILIALFVLPQTAGATAGLYRSLIEVSMWKPVWCVIATIIWSSGISDIQAQGANVSFLSAVCFCLIAAGSLLSTPMVVHSLASGAISSMAQNLSSIGIPGVAQLTAVGAASKGLNIAKKMSNTGVSLAEVASRPSPNVNYAVQHIPKWNVPKKTPIFQKTAPEKRDARPQPHADHNVVYGVKSAKESS
jgi:hypothetical protein